MMFVALVATLLVVVAVQPFDEVMLGGSTSFVPAMLALVVCFDAMSAVLFAQRFRDTGSRRLLVLAAGYLTPLVVLLGWGGAFPGVLGASPPLATSPSNAPWLWVIWHTLFPVMLAAGAAPWPAGWERAVPAEHRRRALRRTVAGSCCAGALIVVGIVWAGDRLPTVIDGLDTTRMTELAGPVMLPLIAAAVVLATLGAIRRGGPERWVAVAVSTAMADVVLTLFSSSRFSIGWYAGRTMTIVSSGVVLIAMLAEYGAMRRRLITLEARQRMLVEHMADGVVMRDSDAEVVAYNPAAAELLGLAPDPADGRVRSRDIVRLTRPDGSEWPADELPDVVALRTGRRQEPQLIGVERSTGPTRWLQVEAAAADDAESGASLVVSTITDVTERHMEQAAIDQARREGLEAIDRVIDDRAIQTVFQPIVDLDTLRVVGVETLSRFPDARSPALWFAEAATLGEGVRLELAAIANALAQLREVDPQIYVSLNVSPATLCSTLLPPLLAPHTGRGLVLELTEHEAITDYDAVIVAIARIREFDVRIAIDDAGSGYASLRHIVNLRPDIIKLDMTLTRGIHLDPARRALAAALVGFGADVGATIIAEGIETDLELRTVRGLGLRVGQGYHLGKPDRRPPVGRTALDLAR